MRNEMTDILTADDNPPLVNVISEIFKVWLYSSNGLRWVRGPRDDTASSRRHSRFGFTCLACQGFNFYQSCDGDFLGLP